MRRSPAFALTALLVAGGLAACGDDGGGDEIASGDGFSVEAALAELPVPDGDGPGYEVVAYDLAAAAEANGAGEAPGDDAASGEWFVEATALAPDDDAPVFVPPARVLELGSQLSLEGLREQAGFGVADVEALAEVVDLGPFRHTVVTGDVGEDAITEAGWEPDDDGVAATGDGDIHVAADGDRLAVGTTEDDVAAWVDGNGPTLADEEPIAAAAVALDDADAVSAYLTTLVPRSAGYVAVGIGWSVDDGEAVQAVAFAFPDDEAADAGAQGIEDDFAEVAELMAVDEVEVDGSVVVARVRPGPEGGPRSPRDALSRAIGPFDATGD